MPKVHTPAEAISGRFGRSRRLWGRFENTHDALKHIDNGSFVDVQPAFEFLFEGGKFASQVAGVCEDGAHLDESADDEDAHLDGARAPEDIGGHDRAVQSKGVGGGT